MKDDSFFDVCIVYVPFSLLLSFEWHRVGKAASTLLEELRNGEEEVINMEV